ncbi:DUF2971 domain-containing protein [Arsenophonus nasoniae]|uniref:DUF2971 domain-containing protein n=1 Tax=Arsenophonus nasoniae TaxID=638 RepID=A0AA95GGK8_9GAMM|nr:DUF2971 domain-containing protein [Arsenophonus nasoniae]WGL96508.1 DUF2971 domain-containing protein [Arsenophonus nasoniae]
MANLYYFTSVKHAISNIENDRIKISLFSNLNDPYELLGINLGNKETRKKFRDLKEQINDEEGLICLSRNWRNPLMWGHYGDRHKGIVLGFEVKDSLWNEVKYESKLIDAPENLSHDFIKKLTGTKFEAWKYEDEVRVIQKLSGNECLFELIDKEEYYFRKFNEDFILKEVILGQKCSLSEMQKCTLLKLSPEVEITKARIAFQDYKVVVNKIKTKEINLLREQLLKESTAV